jgi:hypothetical protein
VRKERRNRPELLPRPAMHARLIIEFRVEFFTRDIQLRHSPDGRSNSLSLSLSFSLCVVVGGKLARMFALCASPRERGGDGRFTPTIFAIRRPKRPLPPPLCFSGAERETQKETYKVPYHNVVPLHLGLLAGQLLALELQPGKTKSSHVRLRVCSVESLRSSLTTEEGGGRRRRRRRRRRQKPPGNRRSGGEAGRASARKHLLGKMGGKRVQHRSVIAASPENAARRGKFGAKRRTQEAAGRGRGRGSGRVVLR